ncbi:putative Hard-surface inducible protein [Seiridium cardinale]
MPTPKDQPRNWIWRFRCNIRSEIGGKFVDLNGGGGRDPAIHGWDDKSWVHNKNQHWQIWSHPSEDDRDTRIVIKSDVTDGYLAGDGHGRRVRCQTGDVFDEQFHWYFEGGDLHNLSENTPVRFRSVRHPSCYLDLSGGDSNNGTPFITYEGHGGSNQAFKLWKR